MFKLLVIIFLFAITFNAKAVINDSNSGYKIPRFVSVKSNDVNLRLGSSTNYPIILKYKVKNLPLEIIDEYKDWRKIIDYEGNKGWIHKKLLKGERYAIIINASNSNLQVYSKPKGKPIGEIGSRNIVKIKICLLKWCLIELQKNKGWISKNKLWGVYKNEQINIPFYQPIINKIWEYAL